MYAVRIGSRQQANEHSLGKGEVDSSILSGSTINCFEMRAISFCAMWTTWRNATQRDLIRQNATATAGEAWQIVRATFAAVADSPLDLRRLVLRLVHSRHEISDCVVYGFAHLR